MIGFYKKRKKEFHEKIIRNHIKYNILCVEKYKLISAEEMDKILSQEEDQAIAKSYDSEVIDKFVLKYGINKELARQSVNTANEALEEYNKLRLKRNKYIKDYEDAEKIKYYKKAIMELKSEGLI